MGGSGGTTSTGGSAGTSTGGSSGQGGTTTTGGSGGSPQVCVPGTYNQEYCPSQCGSKQIGVKVCNTSGTGYGCKCLDPVCEPGLPATCGSNECPAGKVPLYKICVFDGSEFYPCICQDAGTGGSSGSGGTGQGGSSGTGGTAQGGSAGTGGTGGVVNCDVDNDGYKAIACGGDDCNDNDPAMNPGVSYESCDGKDNDCNGLVDEGCGVPPKMWYRDADGDGYGVSSIWQYTNLQPQGYVLNSGDCLDTNANVHPGATELCNGIDDNCDGQTDEGCGTPSATKLVCFYRVPDIAKHDYHAVLWSDKQQTVSTYNAVWGTFTVQNPKENDEFLFSAYRDPPSNNIWQYAGCQWDNPSQLNFEFACYIEKNGNKYATPEVQGVWNNQHNGCNLRVVVQASGATDWDTDGFVLPHDCNDNNADTHPGATDLVGGADNNCNGASDF